MMTVDNSIFPASFRVRVLDELPQPERYPHYYYPGARRNGGGDGVLIEVVPENGQPWIGTFAFGQVVRTGLSGVYTTPDPDLLCVVSNGDGELVSAAKPERAETVRCYPVTDVRLIKAQQLIVFASFTDLVAYGASGVKWRTKRLTWDNMKITEVTDEIIRGEFWDIRNETKAEFIVDLATGTHQGGIVELPST